VKTSPRVLLARPHAFIVNEMRPFLLEAGYAPARPDDLPGLERALAEPAAGAIISTAIRSSVPVDAATVFRMVRQRWPEMPVAFAGMADAATMRAAVERAVQPLAPLPLVVGAAGYRRPMIAAQRAQTFLVLRKDDLVDPAARQAALAALRAHFG
jgi:hypothetical protein